MHIVRVTHVFRPDAIGDPFYSYELSLRQAQRDYKVTVITWNKRKKQLLIEKINSNFTIIRLPGINFSLNNMVTEYPYLPTLSTLLSYLKPDIIHAHSHLFLPTFTAVKTAKNLKTPIIVTIHGLMAKRNLLVNTAQYIYLYTIASWIFKHATKIICLTKSDAQETIKYGCPPEKIKIIPNAVDTDLFKPRNTQKEENSIIWIGRLVPEKGLIYLLKALNIIVNKYKIKVKAIIVGDGPQKPELLDLIHKYDLSQYVHLTGILNKKEVAHILNKAQLFVLPSLKEGLPKALLEAMASGLPAIASNISGINEVIKNHYNGLLVQPQNPQQLAEAITYLLSNPTLIKKLGANARKSIIRKYSWLHILAKLDQVYTEVSKSI